MKRLIIKAQILLLTISCIMAQAQEIKPLKIGDKVPDIVFKKMLFHTTPNGKLSDFKGKAIIIDQWFIGCIPCVTAMPKLDSLQKEFSADLQILPVTFETLDNVETFWSKNIIVKGIKLPQVIDDTLVRKYFPAVNFPQQIWINKNKVIEAITDGKNLNRQNIKKLIDSQKLELPVKVDELNTRVRLSIDPSMLIKYPENKDKLLYYSYFSKYRKEFSGFQRTIVDTAANLVRVTTANSPLFRMYDYAYSNGSWEPRNFSTRFIRKDTKTLKGLAETSNDSTSLFCFDLIFSGTKGDDFSRYMVPELDKFFNLKSHEELIEIKCFVISPSGNGNNFKKPYDPQTKQFQTVDLVRLKKVVANNSYPWFLGAAINDQSEHLVLFELEGAKRINFEVAWNLDDLNMMNVELAKYDLKIESAFRKRKVIILEDQ